MKSDLPDDALPRLLGFSERAARRGFAWDIIGLTDALMFPFFPQTLAGLQLVLAFPTKFFRLKDNISYRVLLTDKQNPSNQAWSDQTLTSSPENVSSTGQLSGSISQAEGQDQGSMLMSLPTGPGSSRGDTVVLPFPSPDLTLTEPSRISIEFEFGDHSYSLGTVACVHAAPDPLTEEEKRAIRSRPNAAGAVALKLTCNQCGDQEVYYDTLSRDVDLTTELRNGVHVSEAGGVWSCQCGNAEIPLEYLKSGIHDLFRRPNSTEEKDVTVYRSFMPLYQAGRIERIVSNYEELIEQGPREQDVQEYLEDYPMFWAFLSPVAVLHKPPVLSKKKADFAVVSSQNILYLVEIEKPETQLLTSGGKVSEQIQRGARQIRDWEMVVADHRNALLSELDLGDYEIHDIRYVLVGGLTSRVDAEGLTKLRRTAMPPKTQFFGFDELASFLHTVSSELRSV